MLDFMLTNTSPAPVTAQLTVRPSASSQGTLTLSKADDPLRGLDDLPHQRHTPSPRGVPLRSAQPLIR